MSNWRKVWNLLDLITIITKFWYFLTLALGCDGLVVVQFEAPILILFSTGVNWFKNRGDVDLSPKVAYLSSATSQRSEFNQLWWGFAKKKKFVLWKHLWNIRKILKGIKRNGKTTRACGKGAKCTDTPGSFTCECAPGYSGDAFIDGCSCNN